MPTIQLPVPAYYGAVAHVFEHRMVWTSAIGTYAPIRATGPHACVGLMHVIYGKPYQTILRHKSTSESLFQHKPIMDHLRQYPVYVTIRLLSLRNRRRVPLNLPYRDLHDYLPHQDGNTVSPA